MDSEERLYVLSQFPQSLHVSSHLRETQMAQECHPSGSLAVGCWDDTLHLKEWVSVLASSVST